MIEEFVGTREWYLKGYDMGWNNALNVFEEKIEEHANNGHKELTVEWLLQTIKDLMKNRN